MNAWIHIHRQTQSSVVCAHDLQAKQSLHTCFSTDTAKGPGVTLQMCSGRTTPPAAANADTPKPKEATPTPALTGSPAYPEVSELVP